MFLKVATKIEHKPYYEHKQDQGPGEGANNSGKLLPSAQQTQTTCPSGLTGEITAITPESGNTRDILAVLQTTREKRAGARTNSARSPVL
ncbi:hypothetical protein KTH_53880 [Thermosporothrix hazakensis]|jgi:hypothetical protein|nr:hypothetical protein KTH_53880 [Thermosporothrix hazakensis]